MKITSQGLVYSRGGDECIFLLKPELDLILESLHHMSEMRAGRLKDRLNEALKIAGLIHNIVDRGLDRIFSRSRTFSKKAEITLRTY